MEPKSSSRNATVYVANLSAHDYTAASEYGVLKPVTIGMIDLTNPDRLLTQIIEETQLSTDEDYLLFSGPPLVCALCLLVWLTKHNTCNMLIFDAKDRSRYIARTITNAQINSAVESLTNS
jgi:hypothetical protein